MRHKTLFTLHFEAASDVTAAKIALIEYDNNAEFGLRLDGDKVKAYVASPVNSDALETFIELRKHALLQEYVYDIDDTQPYTDWLNHKFADLER